MNDVEVSKIFEAVKEQEYLQGLENKMLEQEQAEIPIEHTFAGGVYLRQMFAPKNALILGKRHRNKSCNILLSGEMSVYVGDGKPAVKVTGPLIFESEAGARKLGFCHTDVVFINIFPTDSTDVDEIEKHIIISEDEYKTQIENEIKAYKVQIEGGEKCL